MKLPVIGTVLTLFFVLTVMVSAAQTALGQQSQEGTKAYRNVPYGGTDNPRQKLDLYLPTKRSDQLLPVVVYIHGGGWRMGDKGTGAQVAPFVASGKYAGVSIGYRLTGEASWPAQIHDCKAAIRWIHANAEKYGLDANRIGVFGTSAGGHLAAMLGTTIGNKELEGSLGPHTEASSAVTCVVDFYGPTELLTMGTWHDNPGSPESALVGGTLQETRDVARRASPIRHVSNDDVPFLIIHGTEDKVVPFDQSVKFHAALKAVGVESALLEMPDAGHGDPYKSGKFKDMVDTFLEKHLRGARSKANAELSSSSGSATVGETNVGAKTIEFEGKTWATGLARSVTVGKYKGKQALHVVGGEATYVYLSDVKFQDGVIEVDIASSTFSGIGFRGRQDGTRFEHPYFRPQNSGTDKHTNTVQYSVCGRPDGAWRYLRTRFPGKYEAGADLPKDDWFHARFVIQGAELKIFVNDDPKPVLVVERLLDGVGKGTVGVWGHDAHFANFRCSPAPRTDESRTNASSTALTDDPLRFPEDDYTAKIVTVKTSAGERKVTCHSFMHIPYVAKPVDTDYHSLNVHVPVEIDGQPVDVSRSPILLNIGVGGYRAFNNATGKLDGAEPVRRLPGSSGRERARSGAVPGGRAGLALAAGYVVVSPGVRGRNNQAADGTYYGKAPAAIVDLKAAVRYIRHNRGVLPGNPERIVSVGCSAGGALSALLGASGNSPLYDRYLAELGAADEKDHIFASGCYSPITDLEHSDMSYEWMYGTVPLKSGPVDQGLSNQLRAAYTEYQASLNLLGKDGFGTLTADNYDEYLLKHYLVPSTNKFLAAMSEQKRVEYLAARPWLAWDGSIARFGFSDYAMSVGRMKGFPAFDDFRMARPEPILFGDATTNARHYTSYSLRHANGDPKAEVGEELRTIVKMMNAMYFIGQEESDCAECWWLRNGSRDNHNSQTVMINLATSLENQGKQVDAWITWDGDHCADEDPQGFIAWIGKVTGFSKPALRSNESRNNLSSAAPLRVGTPSEAGAALLGQKRAALRGGIFTKALWNGKQTRDLDRVVTSPYLTGLNATVRWKDFEPQPGHFQWEAFDGVLQLAEQHDLVVTLGIFGGVWTPDWAYEKHGLPAVEFTHTKEMVKHAFGRQYRVPHVWEPDYQNAFMAAVEAMARRYDANPRVVRVFVSGPSFFFNEFHVESWLVEIMQPHGFTERKYIAGWKRALDQYAKVFSHTPLDVALVPFDGRLEPLEELINHAVVGHPVQIVFSNHSLNDRATGNTHHPLAKLYRRFAELALRVPIGFELAEYQMSDGASFSHPIAEQNPAAFAKTIESAIESGACFIHPEANRLLNPANAAAFEKFRAAQATLTSQLQGNAKTESTPPQSNCPKR